MICFLAIKDSNTYNATMKVKCNIGKSVLHNLQIYYEYMCLCTVSTSSSMICCLFSKCISKRLVLSMIMSDNYKYKFRQSYLIYKCLKNPIFWIHIKVVRCKRFFKRKISHFKRGETCKICYFLLDTSCI